MNTVTLALYGPPDPVGGVRSWLGHVKAFADLKCLPLEWLAVRGEGFPAGVVPWAVGEAELLDRDFDGIDSIEVYSSRSRPGALIVNWALTAGLNPRDASSWISCIGERFSMSEINEALVDAFGSSINACYGNGYERELRKGPNLYAVGMVTGLGNNPGDWEQADSIGKWLWKGIQEREYLRGKIRDVYPINILSPKHLGCTVDGLPLANWITTDTKRGALSQVNNELWLWRVEAQEIQNVRSDLSSAGLLIC